MLKLKNVRGYEAALEILKDLADGDEVTASDSYYLGYLYQYGFRTKKNYSHTYKYCKKANTAKAFYQKAILYKYGHGGNKDYKKALEYFKKAYEEDNKKAISGLAVFSEANLISTTDPELIYQIYFEDKSNKITEKKPSDKD